MKETGLMFKTPLVRAILNGQKTQTRRLFSAHTEKLMRAAAAAGEVSHFMDEGSMQPNDLGYVLDFCPLGQPGDRIYVRETFVQGYEADPATGAVRDYDEEGNDVPMTTWYRSTDGGISWSDGDGWETNVPWKPAIHMPKALARIWLEVTSVRVERLQDISEADASREGLQYSTERMGHWCGNAKDWQMSPRQAFRDLWISTGGDWAANPWVWVIDFKTINTTGRPA